jgi:ATP-dependent DNA helicase PIF1
LEKSKSRFFSDTSILPTRLCTHKVDVDFINRQELESLESSAEHTYKSIDEGEARGGDIRKLLNLLCPAKDELRLKVGAQVMLLKNMDVQAGLVNGSRGCVVRFDEVSKAPVVRFINGTEMTVRFETWSFKVSTATGLMVTRRQLPLQLAWAMSIHKSQVLDFSTR